VDKLLLQGIEIHQSPRGFTTAGGVIYPPGSWVVSLAQPKMGLIRYLLGRTVYPDNEWTRSRDGSPMRPYDMATDTMFEFMGVRVDPLDEAPPAGLRKLAAPVAAAGKVAANSVAYSIDGRLNDSFRAVNMLFEKGIAVRRIEAARDALRPGDFVVAGGREDVLAAVAGETGVDFRPLQGGMQGREVRRLRIGMYQRYRGGNIDEGWTRFLLEQFGFPCKAVMDAELKKGGLNSNYDVVILPEDSTAALTGERRESPSRLEEEFPPEYRSGFGKEGVEALKAFVEKGGTLVALGAAGGFAVEKLELRVRNVVAGRSTKEFWCPGSTLRVKTDTANPIAWGMPESGLAVYLAGNAVYEILPGPHNDHYEVVMRYADRDLLESGWLVGEQVIARKAAVVVAGYGQGRVILYGIRPQHRAQTHGTFKIFFNALVR